MRLLRKKNNKNNKNNIYNMEQRFAGTNTRYACNKPSAR